MTELKAECASSRPRLSCIVGLEMTVAGDRGSENKLLLVARSRALDLILRLR